MKKIRAVFTLSLMLIFNLSFVCEAAQTLTIRVVMSEEESVVKYEIRIPENSNIAALNFDVTYDSNVLQYASFETTDIYNSGINQINDTQEGKIVCAFISASAVVGGGSFLRFKFEVKADRTIEYADFCLNIKEIANTGGKKLEYKIEYIDFPEDTSKDDVSNNEKSKNDDEKSKDASSDTTSTSDKENESTSVTDLNANDAKNESGAKGDKGTIETENNDNTTESDFDKSQLAENKSYENEKNEDYNILFVILGSGLCVSVIVISVLVIRGKKEERKQ